MASGSSAVALMSHPGRRFYAPLSPMTEHTPVPVQAVYQRPPALASAARCGQEARAGACRRISAAGQLPAAEQAQQQARLAAAQEQTRNEVGDETADDQGADGHKLAAEPLGVERGD